MGKTREQLWNKHKSQAEFQVKTIKIYSGIISAANCCSAEAKPAGAVRVTHFRKRMFPSFLCQLGANV